jgi:hypothetical protein
MKYPSEQPNDQPEPMPDDFRVVEFLQLHSPIPPNVPPDLEDQIMAMVGDQPQHLPVTRIQSSSPPVWQRYFAYAIPAAIMVGLPLFWLGRALSPQPLTATEYVQLEAFLETNWEDFSASRDRAWISDLSNQYD